jgi:hypothetical protein
MIPASISKKIRTPMLRSGSAVSLGAVLLIAACSGGERERTTTVVPDAPREVFERQALEMPPVPVQGFWHMRVSRSGRMFVKDGSRQTVWMYDSAGTFAGSLGREGKGPGEFIALYAMGINGDTVWASDLNARRITYFSPTGKTLGTERLEDLEPTQQPSSTVMIVLALYPDGRALVKDPVMGMEPGSSITTERFLTIPRSEFAHAGVPRVLDTITTVRYRHGWAHLKRGQESAGLVQPWSDMELFALASDGRVGVRVEREQREGGGNPSYVVVLFGPDGVIGRHEVAYNPRKITDEMVEAAFRRFLSADTTLVQRWGSESALRSAFDDSLYRPPHAPAITDIEIGNDSTVWVKRFQFPETDSSRWDVIDGSGKAVATTRFPASTKLMAVSRSLVWGMEPGEDGEPILVRYRRRP